MRFHRLAVVVILVVGIAVTASFSVAAGPGGWDHLGDGGAPGTRSLDQSVRAFNAQKPVLLYVGGSFVNAGGIADADRIATWNGSTWAALGSSPLADGQVNAIAYHAGKVYAGGTFHDAGGDANADFLAVWDGVSWSPFCTSANPGPAFAGNVNALQVIATKLYVGGSFLDAAGIPAADGLLECDLETGVSRAPVADAADLSGGVYALAADSAGRLYAGGTFINQGGIPAADYVSYWDGVSWNAMGAGAGLGGGAVSGIVRSLTANGSDVYVGSDASDIAGIAQADHVARWNADGWSALGASSSGTDGWLPSSAFINGMTTLGSHVFITGSFQNANGDPRADVVAFFDGTAWHPLGSNGAGDGPLNASGLALAAFDNRLYAGGSFTAAGGDSFAWFAASFALNQVIAQATPTVTPAPPDPTAVATPTVTPTPPLPAPELGETVNAEVQAGTVLVAVAPAGGLARASAAPKYIPLTSARQLAIGSTFDTTRGTVRLVFAAKKAGAMQEGSFSKGQFSTAQSKSTALVTLTVKGASRRACRKTPSLMSQARGAFRSRGRNSRATIRFATWLQTDTCKGTLTTVKSGSATVRDLVKRRNVRLKKGKRYLARPPR